MSATQIDLHRLPRRIYIYQKLAINSSRKAKESKENDGQLHNKMNVRLYPDFLAIPVKSGVPCNVSVIQS